MHPTRWPLPLRWATKMGMAFRNTCHQGVCRCKASDQRATPWPFLDGNVWIFACIIILKISCDKSMVWSVETHACIQQSGQVSLVFAKWSRYFLCLPLWSCASLLRMCSTMMSLMGFGWRNWTLGTPQETCIHSLTKDFKSEIGAAKFLSLPLVWIVWMLSILCLKIGK